MKDEKVTLTKAELKEYTDEIVKKVEGRKPRITKESILSEKDIVKRQELIKENLDLFE